MVYSTFINRDCKGNKNGSMRHTAILGQAFLIHPIAIQRIIPPPLSQVYFQRMNTREDKSHLKWNRNPPRYLLCFIKVPEKVKMVVRRVSNLVDYSATVIADSFSTNEELPKEIQSYIVSTNRSFTCDLFQKTK